MDKRSLCYLIICVNLCFVLWLVSVQQLETTTTTTGDDSAAVGSGISAAAASASASVDALQLQPSANGSKPYQIPHDSSRQQQQQQLSSNSNNLSIYSPPYSIVSVDTAPTLTAMLTQSSSASSPREIRSDAEQLIDLHNFAYLMVQPECEAHVQVLILVHTAPRNAEKRSLIRQTWGMPQMTQGTSPLRVVFLLGAATAQLQRELELENARYADMVQGNFQDAYRNMTYKHVMALKWFNQRCAHAQLLIKVDDDVFVNTPQLLKLFRDAPGSVNSSLSTTPASLGTGTVTPLRTMLQQHRELLFCRPVLASRVKRSYRSKWRVSFKEYPAHYYPPYCPGFAIVYSADVVQRLYQAAQRTGYFWVDDVHITGVLAEQTNTTITDLQPYVLYSSDLALLLKGDRELDQQEFLFTWHSIAPEQISALWQLHLTQLQNYTQPSQSELAGTAAEGGFS